MKNRFNVGDEYVVHTMVNSVECVKDVVVVHVTDEMVVVRTIKEPQLRQTFNRYGVIGKPGLSGHVWLTRKVIG